MSDLLASNLRSLLERALDEGFDYHDGSRPDCKTCQLYAEIEAALRVPAETIANVETGPTPHSVRYDITGWLCSVCGGWNADRQQGCAHPHSPLKTSDNPTHQHAEGCPKLYGGVCACNPVPL